MRRRDEEQLERLYPAAGTNNEKFATSIGVVVPSVGALQREVFDDLDESDHGIRWWAPEPGTSRRILIGDHLWICIFTGPNGPSTHSLGFTGYKPGAAPFYADVMVGDSTFPKRLKSAALDDANRKKWPTFT